MTVLDTGGIDRLDFAATSVDQVISLVAESLSSVLGGRHNKGIARGTVIEYADSGAGNDYLYGNSAANRLYGGDGSDTLRGMRATISLMAARAQIAAKAALATTAIMSTMPAM